MSSNLDKDIRLASTIISSFLNGPPVEIKPVVGKGNVNKVFIAEAVNHKVVIRMSDRGEALDEYNKEAWCIEQAAAKGIPVPSVLGIGQCEGNAYIIESYIAGDDGIQSPTLKLRIWRELGKYARLIHSIGVQGFGARLSEITRGNAQESWVRYLEYNIENLTENDPLIKRKVLTRLQSKLIRNIFADLRRHEFTFGLIHGDLSLRNTIVDKCGRVHLLDWGSAEAGIVPHHDLVEMLMMNMISGDPEDAQIRAFLDGYEISQAEFKQMMPQLESLLVLRTFNYLRSVVDWNAEMVADSVFRARLCVSYLLRAAV
jgi:aminoglycoside phosphotransferase (APT) family kinase protein